MQICRIFFFFAFLSPVLVLFSPSYFFSYFFFVHLFSYHFFSVPSLSRLNVFFLFGIYFRTSLLQPTLEERIFIFLYSLLCQVRKASISMLFLTCIKYERRQFTWSHMADSSWVACLFILINTFREMVRLQPTLWGEGRENRSRKKEGLGVHQLCVWEVDQLLLIWDLQGKCQCIGYNLGK